LDVSDRPCIEAKLSMSCVGSVVNAVGVYDLQ
jgi:hypothetical protein